MKNSITNQDIVKEWSKISIKVLEEFGDKGDFARQNLITPAVFNLLGDIQGKRILDVGSGSGYLSRLLAQKGAIVTGIEPVERLYDYAVKRQKEEKLPIKYIKIDVDKHVPLGKPFDIVIANMVLMDIPDYQSVMKYCIDETKKDGTFLFSITHPCFEMSGKEWRDYGYVKVEEYFDEYAYKRFFGRAFHRPLSEYINFLGKNSCCIQKMIEPRLTEKGVGDHKEYAKDVYVPSFLIVSTKKCTC